MSTKLLALALLVGGTMFGQVRVSVGVGVGGGGYYPGYYAPPPPPRVVAYRPLRPGPGFVWVPGYWHPAGRSYAWRAGFWTRPPYIGARWVSPRYHGRRYYGGYWRR
jgi:hypothetical protein